MACKILLALFVAGCVSASDVTPTEKVITLLEDLKSEVEADGKDEATLYDTFACFCQSMTESKSDSITTEQDNIDTFNSEIESQTIISKNKAIEIEEANNQIAEVTKTRQETESRREKEKEKYETNSADLNKGVANLEAAVTDLQAGLGGAALVTLKKSIRRTFVMADLMGLAHGSKQKKAITKFLQESEEEEDDDSEEDGPPAANDGSKDIITTMNDLLTDFKEQKANIESIEGQNKADYTASMKALQSQEDSATESVDAATAEKDAADEEVAKNTKDLEEETARFNDDSLYLKDLTRQCELKAREFDQHSETRSGELEALAAALDIIKNKVKGNADEAVKRAALLTNKVKVTSTDGFVSEAQRELENDELNGIADVDKWSLVQTSNPRNKLASLLSHKRTVSGQKLKHKMSAEAMSKRTAAIADALEEAGVRLKSPVLNAFALKLRTKLAFDPFVKVRKLVQDLIQRLIEEATAEATKKGFCDVETAKSKHARDKNMEEVSRLNAETEGLEAQKARLEEEISELTAELAELDDALFKSTKLRADEKAENLETVSKSKAGLEAINDAKKVLEDFYDKSKKNEVSLLTTGKKASPVLEDQPEAPKGGAYKGGQQKAGGIIAMIDVIASDFERTIRVTEQTEKDSQREFVEFERTSKSSLASKTNQKANAESSLKATTNGITGNMDLLDSRMKMLDDNLRELEELKPTCVNTGMSFAERTQKREEEIDALKKAMCMLDGEGVEANCPP